jgi:hypothetical protein
MNIFAYSNDCCDSSMTDEGMGVFFLSYSNLNNTKDNTQMFGGGFILYDTKHTRFLEAEFLFPIGDNPVNFKSPFMNIKAGIPIITVGNFQKRKLSVEFIGGLGLSNFNVKDINNKTLSMDGFQPFFGMAINFGHFFLRTTGGPIFTTGLGNFGAGTLYIGFQK